MALLLALTLSAQGNRVYIEDFEIEPGATDSVLVLLSNVDPSRGLQFNLSLPQGLEICEYDLTVKVILIYQTDNLVFVRRVLNRA